ncbi:cob(I)yrinic acid a,c-diamide adenosyltransferase [Acidipropionibacterium jensenii]|uniref:Cob(I)yrinic acid a,c-diamide adenosyltransferase n=1 Tax=Acidipropionibacterium jensenii TaxID=1749 RepID=A0A3S4W8S1_9ACTN|nr:cob(I)yrinic acid a,c-diamide adenosyltransferase [Acidipropionibacterium jensenii]AZZ38467.1 cob(I)yrinic acid a,c-diamide adenosyltransferase [Acidipropionibacterium jensenii]AZZ40998.1 cob(I)yrinic acid a,c-diamide adenosyltransferase [Acidipropionibacterium jensenii]MDN5977917.1 cob(I)yrinic acid a,c-diamide adenosyltransferase [Acidipropionibacterium jensenii]MDN5996894.1 cob(I)yrinic acid a,c-diamide adenosyltransferase [Acidipropionibacterium jensenii]MDN6427612.1 cob(I)yrinic acid a
MPRAHTDVDPDDGLSTRQRRLRPVLAVNTGDGKGKTTAAMGTALRAWHQGWSVGVFQFIKSGRWHVGEQDALEALGRIHRETGVGGPVTWETMGTGWSWTKAFSASEDPAEAAREGWRHVRSLLAEQALDFYLLDEFSYPLDWGWIDVDEVVDVLTHRPGTQHVVITGRRAPDTLIEAADLVTEMTKIKHPFDAGQRGQAGIEW